MLDISTDGHIHAIEIKSGKTYRSDYFDSLHYVQSVLGERVVPTCVIYDGDQQAIQPFDSICRYDTF